MFNTFCLDNNRNLEIAINIFYIVEIQYFLISIICEEIKNEYCFACREINLLFSEPMFLWLQL